MLYLYIFAIAIFGNKKLLSVGERCLAMKHFCMNIHSILKAFFIIQFFAYCLLGFHARSNSYEMTCWLVIKIEDVDGEKFDINATTPWHVTF